MENDFLPFSRPTISEEAIDEVVECLRSGWITTGPRVKQFTEMLKEYLHSPFVLPLSSATAGLHLSLLALDLKSGDEVITTPMTFAATANCIIHAGAKPVFVDVDPNTFNIDIDLVAKAITPNTKAVIPVHFAGLSVDCDPLYALAKKHQLHIIEDAAHAIGSEYKGKRIGSFGHTHVYSFHPNKNMTTGEGGCVSTFDEALAEKIALLRFHGMDREAWNRYGKSGKQDYEIVLPGYKYNMMDIQAAIGIHQLPKLDSFIERRSQIANRYIEELKDWPELFLPQPPNYEQKHAWHIFTPLINHENAGMNRAEFMEAMKQENIGTGLHYRALHLYPYYQEQFGYQHGDFPHAEKISERIVSLPLFPTMTDEEQTRVIDTMKKIFNKV
ncbi:MAG: DegT/DnrJ/EryC1/StrS family aminotransferase [Gammaproteobacteria bacterium]